MASVHSIFDCRLMRRDSLTTFLHTNVLASCWRWEVFWMTQGLIHVFKDLDGESAADGWEAFEELLQRVAALKVVE